MRFQQWWKKGRLVASMATLIGSMPFAAPAAAQTAIPKVLVIGDMTAGAGPSSNYANAAFAEMQQAVIALGGQASDVTFRPIDINNTGGSIPLSASTLDASDFLPKYDVVVLTAVWGGLNSASVGVLQTAIQNRSANAFFLFPDQCSSCAPNIDNITKPIVNAATGWAISTGSLFDNSNVHGAGTTQLNTLTPLASSFTSLAQMVVWDYRAINGVPAYNALYMPVPFSDEPAVAMPTQIQVDNRTPVGNVAALIVPRAQSFGGAGACIFTISDVNTLTTPGNPAVGKLGGILLNASKDSCAVDSGTLTINKTLMPPPSGAVVSWPVSFAFATTCTPVSGSALTFNSTLSFSAAGTQSVDIESIPAGASCTVTETLPANPAAYQWVDPGTQTATIVNKAKVAVSFTNQLAGLPGSIRITKNLALPPDVAGPINLQFSALCDLPTANTVYGPVTINYPAQTSADIVNVPAGAQCQVTETLPAAPAGYEWATPDIGPAAVTIEAATGASVAVKNELRTATTPVAAAVPLGGDWWKLAVSLLLMVAGFVAFRRNAQRRTACRQP